MGYYLNRLDEHVFMAVSKPLLTEFGRLIRELCDTFDVLHKAGHDYMVEVQYPCHFVAF